MASVSGTPKLPDPRNGKSNNKKHGQRDVCKFRTGMYRTEN